MFDKCHLLCVPMPNMCQFKALQRLLKFTHYTVHTYNSYCISISFSTQHTIDWANLRQFMCILWNKNTMNPFTSHVYTHTRTQLSFIKTFVLILLELLSTQFIDSFDPIQNYPFSQVDWYWHESEVHSHTCFTRQDQCYPFLEEIVLIPLRKEIFDSVFFNRVQSISLKKIQCSTN